jgi:hypothetical protein
MDQVKQENEKLKKYLTEAMEIADFTVSGHGFFIKQQLWALKNEIDKSEIMKFDALEGEF